MTPGPSLPHQEISQILERKFDNFLEGKPFRMFHAPFDLLLPQENEDDLK